MALLVMMSRSCGMGDWTALEEEEGSEGSSVRWNSSSVCVCVCVCVWTWRRGVWPYLSGRMGSPSRVNIP